MKPIWAIDPGAYEAFLAELSLRLRTMQGLTPKQLAGPIEDARRAGLPVLELPFTVGGNQRAGDLFGLFDSTIALLLEVQQ